MNRTDRRPTARNYASFSSGPRQEWVPRGSSSSAPLLPNPGPSPRLHASSTVAEIPQLVQEIEDKLARSAVECMICYDMVRRSSPMWSCSNCFSVFHLHCIRKWSKSPTSSSSSLSTDSWRCPGCQSVQSTPAKDLPYTCFCGRRRDPHNDFHLSPHSCARALWQALGQGGWARGSRHPPSSASCSATQACARRARRSCRASRACAGRR